MCLRLVIAGSGYRKPLAFNDDVVADGERALERLRGALRPATGSTTSGPAVDALAAQAAQARTDFEAAMDDDFNTAGGLAALFDFVRAINTARDAGVGGQPFADAQAIFNALIGVLGLQSGDARSRRPVDCPVRRSAVDHPPGSAQGQAVGALRQNPRRAQGVGRGRGGLGAGQHMAAGMRQDAPAPPPNFGRA